MSTDTQLSRVLYSMLGDIPRLYLGINDISLKIGSGLAWALPSSISVDKAVK